MPLGHWWRVWWWVEGWLHGIVVLASPSDVCFPGYYINTLIAIHNPLSLTPFLNCWPLLKYHHLMHT
jgi:hypothetical protein